MISRLSLAALSDTACSGGGVVQRRGFDAMFSRASVTRGSRAFRICVKCSIYSELMLQPVLLPSRYVSRFLIIDPRSRRCSEDVVAEAAALMESLAINHPFVDGNKRTAFAAADVFLRINGYRLHRPPMQIYAEMMQMFESGTFDISHLEPWLRGFASAGEGWRNQWIRLRAGVEQGRPASFCRTPVCKGLRQNSYRSRYRGRYERKRNTRLVGRSPGYDMWSRRLRMLECALGGNFGGNSKLTNTVYPSRHEVWTEVLAHAARDKPC